MLVNVIKLDTWNNAVSIGSFTMEILCPDLLNISIKQHPFYSNHLDVSGGTIYCASCWSINIYSAQLTSDLYTSTDNNTALFIHIEFCSSFFCFYCENVTQFTIVINMRQRSPNAEHPHFVLYLVLFCFFFPNTKNFICTNKDTFQ